MNKLATPKKLPPSYARSEVSLSSSLRQRTRQLKQIPSSFSVTSNVTYASESPPAFLKRRSASPGRSRQYRSREDQEFSRFLDRLEHGESGDELNWKDSSLELSVSFEQPRTLAARWILTYYFPALKVQT